MSGKEEVTVERLQEEIAKILEGADLKTTSTKKVRLALEKIFADVKPWAKKIDEIVMDHVEKMSTHSDDDIDDLDESRDEEDDDIDDLDEGSDEEDAKVKKEVPSSEEEVVVKKPRRAPAAASKKKEVSEDDDDDSEEEKKKKPAKKPNTRKRKSSADDNDYKPAKSAKGKKEKAKPMNKTETSILVNLVESYTVITSKATNALNNKLKEEAWAALADEFNTKSSMKRTAGQLRLKWENLKKLVRKRAANIWNEHLKGGGGKSNGYTKPYKLSPALSELMGAAEMPRHEVVRRVWAIIKEKNLYDPSNKQFAICDEALYSVIGVKKFRTFGMMKYLKDHFIT